MGLLLKTVSPMSHECIHLRAPQLPVTLFPIVVRARSRIVVIKMNWVRNGRYNSGFNNVGQNVEQCKFHSMNGALLGFKPLGFH